MLYIEPEVLLANLLYDKNADEGVSVSELLDYSDSVKEAVWEVRSDAISIIINSNEIDWMLIKYHSEFRKFRDDFFNNRGIALCRFNCRVSPDVASILVITARKFWEEKLKS